jgi:hypothetical protein
MDGEAYAAAREALLTGQIDPQGQPATPDPAPVEPAPGEPAAPANEPEPPATPPVEDPAATPGDDEPAVPGKGYRPRLDALPDVEKEAIALRKQLTDAGKDVSLKDCLARVEAKYGIPEGTPDIQSATVLPDPATVRAKLDQIKVDLKEASNEADTVKMAELTVALSDARDELDAANQAVNESVAAFKADMAKSVTRARTLYPGLKDEATPLARKWHEVMARLQDNNDPLLSSGNPNVPFIVSQMAAAELGIAPVNPQAPPRVSPPVPPTPQPRPAPVQLAPGSARSQAPANPIGQLASEMASIKSMDDWETFKAKALAG